MHKFYGSFVLWFAVTNMERPRSSPEQVNILSDDSSSDDNAGPESKRLRTSAEIPQRALQTIPEGI